MAQSTSHYGLVLSQKLLGGYSYVNIGRDLSSILQNEDSFSPAFPIKALDLLRQILNSSIRTDAQGRSYLALDNYTILFEPALKINLRAIIESYAKQYLLILRTEGITEGSATYYPFPEDKSFKLDLTNLNYTTIA